MNVVEVSSVWMKAVEMSESWMMILDDAEMNGQLQQECRSFVEVRCYDPFVSRWNRLHCHYLEADHDEKYPHPHGNYWKLMNFHFSLAMSFR